MIELLFEKFPSIGRLNRDMVITEKIDGTNAQVIIGDNGEFATASRSRIITPEKDNYGFAAWAEEHKAQLLTLGPGRHFGEWWGPGIQRRYGIAFKRFSLFNVGRYTKEGVTLPACVSLVPVLFEGPFDTDNIRQVMSDLREKGSVASPGFMLPEGIVIFHEHAKALFKTTFEGDEKGKSHGA